MVIFATIDDYKMKKFYYITFVAAIAIACIQAFYIVNLYNGYKAEKITMIERLLALAIDDELHIRNLDPSPIDGRSVVSKTLEDMTPWELDSILKLPESRELDSLMRLNVSEPLDFMNIDKAREKNIGKTGAEVHYQLSQDRALRKGNPLNIDTLNRIFADTVPPTLVYNIVRYDKDTLAVDSAGYDGQRAWNYISELHPIGTKGLCFLRVKAIIPYRAFVWQHLWALLASLGIMGVSFVALYLQLKEIKEKNELLQKREATINGTIHDLKSPLNGVVTMLSWFKSTEKDTTKRDMMEKGLANVKHLVHTIESLLIIARCENHRIVPHKTDVDLLALTNQAKRELAFLYPEKYEHIRIDNRLPEKQTVQADAMYIENVIRNLLENALKYSDDDVKVTVTLEREGDKLVVSVQDTGWGIAPRYQKRLFTQFYQVPREAGKTRTGYGIGLAQAHYIINEHNGEIRVSSEEGSGSVFSFSLPLFA